MKRTDNFRRQHDDILKITSEISNKLNPQSLSQDSSQILILISKLAGKVKIHLSMEDQALYPRLLQNNDENLKDLAKKYISEMGNISEVFSGYLTKWKTAQSIQENSTKFIIDTKSLFSTLSKRIEKENNELYEFVDNAA